MSDLLKLIQEADVVAFEMEKARAAVESSKLALEKAKENFEQSKKAFDEVLTKADELGVPRPKVRKLIEERTLGLVSSGLIEGDGKPPVSKPAKAPKAAKPKSSAKKAELDEDSLEFDEAMERSPASLELV